MDFDNIKDFAKAALVVFGIYASVAVVVLGAIFVPAYYCTKYTCESKAEQMGLEHEFGLFKGCFVKEDDKWIPLEQVRTVR